MIALAGAAALVSLLELDAVQVGQLMISRPIVIGPLLGLVLGIPALGLALGAACELLGLDDLPMGHRLPLNGAVAAAAGVLLCAAARPLRPELAFPAGLAAGWLHQRLECLLRERRSALCGCAEARVRGGAEPRLGGLALRALSEQASATFVFLIIVVFAGGPALAWLWARTPEAVIRGLGFAWAVAPWLGIGLLLHALKAVPWRA